MTSATASVDSTVRELRDEVRQHLRSGRVILAVDGVPGAGQGAFADALAAAFAEAGDAVVRASIEAFGDTAELRRSLVEPFRSAGPGGFVLSPGQQPQSAPADAVLIVDGAFLLGPELRGLWNWSVWLEVHPTSAFARLAAQRGADPDPDAASNAPVRDAVRAFRRGTDPRPLASALVENTDAAAPVRIFGDFC